MAATAARELEEPLAEQARETDDGYSETREDVPIHLDFARPLHALSENWDELLAA